MPWVDSDGLERGLYAAEDYWGLPDDRRAELINGVLYDMAPPSTQHQAIVAGMVADLTLHVRGRGGPCRVYGVPVAVRLNCGSNDESWVEPDVIVVCDPAKISDRGCEGAPDLAVEVVSPSSRQKDYLIKTLAYERAGVREYWIVDAACEQVAVYRFEADGPHLTTYAFADAVPVSVFDGQLALTVDDYR